MVSSKNGRWTLILECGFAVYFCEIVESLLESRIVVRLELGHKESRTALRTCAEGAVLVFTGEGISTMALDFCADCCCG
jgi:hypothetical protein